MAAYYEKDGILYVVRNPDRTFGPVYSHRFRSPIVYDPTSRRWYATRGGQDVTAYVQFAPRTPLWYENTYLGASQIVGRPRLLWPYINTNVNAPFLSYQLSSSRWVRVLAFMDRFAGFLSVPIWSSDMGPWLDPALPPLIFASRHYSHGQDDTDKTISPGAAGVGWSDHGHYKAIEANIAAASFEGTSVLARCRPRLDPVPHWVLEIHSVSGDWGGPNYRTVMIDMLGNGFGEPNPISVSVGTNGVVGHYLMHMMWPAPDLLEASSLSDFNQRMFESGAIDVAESSSASLYLTTGANKGLSTGTSNFSTGDTDIPAVHVQGHSTLGSYIASASSALWSPETFGLGINQTSATSVVGRERAYVTRLQKDGASGKWRLDVFNNSPAAGGANNRSFIAWAIGR
jgi:hypothetical protein